MKTEISFDGNEDEYTSTTGSVVSTDTIRDKRTIRTQPDSLVQSRDSKQELGPNIVQSSNAATNAEQLYLLRAIKLNTLISKTPE